jgi:hypothetical protein
MVVRFIDEHPGHRLGRHVEHDPRSRRYPFRATTPVQTTVHRIRIPVLDQGQLGSCTGNAAVACVGSDPLFEAVPADRRPNPTNAQIDERLAVRLYSAATQLDEVQGQYPPTDTGSSGLAVAKAAKAQGLIAGYQHAFSLEAALQALVLAPLITGVHWYQGFDHPAADGRVSIAGEVRGGHEFVVYGVDAERRVVLARNSWGTAWGNGGTFYFSWDDWGRLLSEQGDATIFVPLSDPAPTPDPEPTRVPTQADRDLVAAVDRWKRETGL